jgi:hypothetical protein
MNNSAIKTGRRSARLTTRQQEIVEQDVLICVWYRGAILLSRLKGHVDFHYPCSNPAMDGLLGRRTCDDSLTMVRTQTALTNRMRELKATRSLESGRLVHQHSMRSLPQWPRRLQIADQGQLQ